MQQLQNWYNAMLWCHILRHFHGHTSLGTIYRSWLWKRKYLIRLHAAFNLSLSQSDSLGLCGRVDPRLLILFPLRLSSLADRFGFLRRRSGNRAILFGPLLRRTRPIFFLSWWFYLNYVCGASIHKTQASSKQVNCENRVQLWSCWTKWRCHKDTRNHKPRWTQNTREMD